MTNKAIHAALLTAKGLYDKLPHVVHGAYPGSTPADGTMARGGAAAVNESATPPLPRPSKPIENEHEPLFDYSRLSEVPKVPQVDLPRYEPARGVPERVQTLMKSKKVKGKMLETIKSGLDKGGANWYNTDPLRDEFIKHLGHSAGDAAHRQYMEFVAATSPRSEVGANARNASYYYHRHMTGQGMPKVGDRNPQPYGHMAQRLHQMNAERVAGEGWDPLNNPKPASFVENLAGNQKPVTVDTHAFRLPAIHAQDPRFLETAYQSNKDAPKQNIQKLVESGELPIKQALSAHWQAQPKSSEYGAMEAYYQKLAKELGITPAQAQAAAWVGGGKLTGLASDESKPFLRFLQDRIYKTAQETGRDPKDVLEHFIRGKAPLRAAGGAVDTAKQVLNPQGLYSGAGAAAAALPQAKGTPQQMLATMKGVKPEELAHSGAAQAFAGQPSVTRDQLAQHFQKALPKIRETRLSDDDVEQDEDGDLVGAPQYKDYSLPSGQNYRELLLHLPEAKPQPPQHILDAYKRAEKNAELDAQQWRLKHEFEPKVDENGFMTADPMEHPEYANIQSRLRHARSKQQELHAEANAKARAQNYHSSHWDTPNVLAHLRMSDRFDPTSKDGGKMLHLEELQSDWGQEGREKGFKDPSFDPDPAAKESAEIMRRSLMGEHVSPEEDKRAYELNRQVEAHENKVPHGPYVGSTNGWVDLGLKRALREAAVNGHERLAWTPGAEQADRYGLHKKLSRLVYGAGQLRGFRHGDENKLAVHQDGVAPEELPRYVGKELAERLLHPDNTHLGGTKSQYHMLEGGDLRMGGEGMKGFYDKLVPLRLKEILKKLGHEAQFEPVTITHGPRKEHTGNIDRKHLQSTLHSVLLPEELREKIKNEGMPAFKDGGDVVARALRAAARPAKMYSAGGNVSKEPDYDTVQDGPFYRVARRDLAASGRDDRQGAQEVRGPGAGALAGGAGPLGDGAAQSPAEARLAQLQQIADHHAGKPVVDDGNSESSLHKQSAIGRAFQLAATDHPGYKQDVFAAYLRLHPDMVRHTGARDYDSLRAAAYKQLGHEVKRQFHDLPLKMSFHKHGEGDYASSKHMRKDVLENGHLHVFQGGHKHDFLHHVDRKTELSQNEMFRAIHDAYGHALHGSGFGAKGEERAWNAHRQMFSPLAALAMSAETRGQNSFVNYTPINAALTAKKHEIEAEIARARRFKDTELENELQQRKKEVMNGWQYAPQKAVLLPPEMIDPKYEGGMPDYVQKHIAPEPGTGFSSPISHYSTSPDVKELDPSRYGTGIPGDERSRVLKRPGGVKERAYGYLGAPGAVPPEPGLGPHAYAGRASNLYDMTKDPLQLGTLATEANRNSPLGNFNPGAVNQGQAMNDFERMAKEHGYSGVANPKATYPMAALFNKTPVQLAASDDTVQRALRLTSAPTP
jgi:hypothetical protein